MIVQKYFTVWGHPAILLCNKLYNNIDRIGGVLRVFNFGVKGVKRLAERAQQLLNIVA
jgi:hypothetical protein